MTRRRALALIAIAVAAAAVAGGLQRLGIGTRLELESVDARFRLHGPAKPPAGVVLVQVDEKTLSDLHRRWPFPRALQARLIDRVAAARPRAIAIDLEYTEPTTVDDDNALIEAIHHAGHVVLATTAVNDQGETNVLGGDAVVSEIGARVGSALMPLDADGAIRRAAYQVEGLESFAVVGAEMATNRQVEPFDSKTTWIRFAGPPGTLRAYSYSDVLRGRVPAAALRGRVVVVGTSALRLKDASTTSTTRGSLMSGPEVQANAIATVLAGLPLTSPGAAVDAALILLLAGLAPLAGLRLGAVGVTVASAGATLAFLAAAQWLFAGGLIIPVVHPLAALLAGLLGVLAVARPRAREAPPRAVPAAPAPAETAADEIAGFRLEGLIGRGGMGVVYRARQPGLDRVVAVKVIAPARAADPGFRERFAREARLAAAIEHPNIVPVYSTGEDRGQLYLVMRYIDGVNLAERLGEGPLAPAAVAEIVGDVASALDAAHLRGLIHRDVKPANILLADRAFLTDFGITRELDATMGLTRTGVFVGSVEYAAPEQASGPGPAADQYSLGCVAYECLTGAPPFGRDRDLHILWAHAHETPRPPSELVGGLPADIDAAVLRALAKQPGERWATCTEFARRLASALLGRV
jgi:serine/threonine-protein kinase